MSTTPTEMELFLRDWEKVKKRPDAGNLHAFGSMLSMFIAEYDRMELALAAALRSPGQQAGEPSEWRPIETAPKDMGSRLYLVGRFCVQGFIDVTGTLQAQTEIPPHWRKMRGKPTHWMPLPKAPARVSIDIREDAA